MTRSVLLVLVVAVLIVGLAAVVYRSFVAPTEQAVRPPQPSQPQLAVVDAGVVAAATLDAGAPDPMAASFAELTSVRGAVQVRAGEAGAWVPAAVGLRLGSDDAIRAGRSAEASLRMGDGVEVRLSPRSQFSIKELSTEVSKIRLEEGHVTASVDDNGRRVLKVQAKGSDAEAESRGGTFGIVADGRGQLAVATTTGQVKLTAKGQSVDVAAGNQSAILDGGVPSAPVEIPKSLYLKVGDLAATRTKETSTLVAGSTTPGALVRVGDQTARSDPKGRFALRVPLKDGKNVLAIEVVDASGRQEQKTLPPVVVDRVKPGIEADVKWGGSPN